mgnify:CR=1 FL=1
MYLKATNITSPLGDTTEENYEAVRNGRTAIRRYGAGVRGVPFPIAAALFTEEPDFVRLAIKSAHEALLHADSIDVASSRTLFVLSTTKGEIGIPPGDTAKKIANAIGVTTMPVVVCNACISGVAAQILAMRMIDSALYDTVIVTGCDVQTKFIISGFNCLKALSPEPCRPFDEERLGLNLGEGAATMIFTAKGDEKKEWQTVNGAIRNDAYHISGPHPKGEGCYRALKEILQHCSVEELATVGVHGTATMYNDQMESKAIERASLSNIPLSALKGYYGHTMGAAGVIETILTARALDDGIILPSMGYSERGVSGKVTISPEAISTGKHSFIKMLSGFGGCNAAVLYTKGEANTNTLPNTTLNTVATVKLTSKDDLTAIYKERIGNYPKFYKMDTLSRLAFVATELLKAEVMKRNDERTAKETLVNDDCAVILFNRTSSCISDHRFIDTIKDDDNFFPSPAVFVYTLPNITTGEIALRNGWHSETSFYILPDHDEQMMNNILTTTAAFDTTRCIISGWINADENGEYEVEVKFIMHNA